MKFLIVFSLLIVAALAHHENFQKKNVDDFRKARAECFEKFHISDEIKEKLKKFEYPDEEAVYNYIHCTSSNLGAWHDGEGFSKDNLKVQFGDTKSTILDKCITKNDHQWTNEKWAWNNWKCLVEEGLIKEDKEQISHH